MITNGAFIPLDCRDKDTLCSFYTEKYLNRIIYKAQQTNTENIINDVVCGNSLHIKFVSQI